MSPRTTRHRNLSDFRNLVTRLLSSKPKPGAKPRVDSANPHDWISVIPVEEQRTKVKSDKAVMLTAGAILMAAIMITRGIGPSFDVVDIVVGQVTIPFLALSLFMFVRWRQSQAGTRVGVLDGTMVVRARGKDQRFDLTGLMLRVQPVEHAGARSGFLTVWQSRNQLFSCIVGNQYPLASGAKPEDYSALPKGTMQMGQDDFRALAECLLVAPESSAQLKETLCDRIGDILASPKPRQGAALAASAVVPSAAELKPPESALRAAVPHPARVAPEAAGLDAAFPLTLLPGARFAYGLWRNRWMILALMFAPGLLASTGLVDCRQAERSVMLWAKQNSLDSHSTLLAIVLTFGVIVGVYFNGWGLSKQTRGELAGHKHFIGVAATTLVLKRSQRVERIPLKALQWSIGRIPSPVLQRSGGIGSMSTYRLPDQGIELRLTPKHGKAIVIRTFGLPEERPLNVSFKSTKSEVSMASFSLDLDSLAPFAAAIHAAYANLGEIPQAIDKLDRAFSTLRT